MNRQTFLKILTKEIRGLPKEEQKNALEYYKEHLNECENEEIAIKNLPHPSEIAKNLYDELGIEKYPARYYSPLAITGIVVLTILFGPLGFGLFVALFSLIVIVPVSMVIATGSTAVASIIVIFPAIFTDFPSAVSFLGIGILSFGTCMLFIKITQFTFGLFVSLWNKTVQALRGY